MQGSLEPRRASSEPPSTNPKTPQLMVIPLKLLYQRDGPCKGRLKKTSSGQEKKDQRRLNRSKNSLDVFPSRSFLTYLIFFDLFFLDPMIFSSISPCMVRLAG